MKRVLSILSIVAMLITMLATIVVPVSAETTTLVNQFVLNTNNMYYVNANGTTGASNNFYSSDYIEVAAGDTLYLGPCDPDHAGCPYRISSSYKSILLFYTLTEMHL